MVTDKRRGSMLQSCGHFGWIASGLDDIIDSPPECFLLHGIERSCFDYHYDGTAAGIAAHH